MPATCASSPTKPHLGRSVSFDLGATLFFFSAASHVNARIVGRRLHGDDACMATTPGDDAFYWRRRVEARTSFDATQEESGFDHHAVVRVAEGGCIFKFGEDRTNKVFPPCRFRT